MKSFFEKSYTLLLASLCVVALSAALLKSIDRRYKKDPKTYCVAKIISVEGGFVKTLHCKDLSVSKIPEDLREDLIEGKIYLFICSNDCILSFQRLSSEHLEKLVQENYEEL